MEEIYNYIAEQLQSPETAIGQYNRIAGAIEALDTFPERVMPMETEEGLELGLRKMPVDNFSVFFSRSETRVDIICVERHYRGYFRAGFDERFYLLKAFFKCAK